MPIDGFSVLCPQCGHLTKWEKHPKEVTVKTKEEFLQILKYLSSNPKYRNDKVLRCENPQWSCPVSYIAVVLNSEQQIKDYLPCIKAWSFIRDFRLLKYNGINRWDEGDDRYYGVLFYVEPVPRLQDIELESSMDRDLLSRIIRGVEEEIQAPVTFYAANIFIPDNGKSKIEWMPIEAYPRDEMLYPNRHNHFCRTCRNIILNQIKQQFESEDVGPRNCQLGYWQPATKTCAGKEAACLKDPVDWNHCPLFIEKRKTHCPCYRSDYEAIQRIERKWKDDNVPLTDLNKEERYQCFAGFHEAAVPVTVHNHLIAVAMTGQVYHGNSDIVDVDSFASSWNLLRQHGHALKEGKTHLLNELDHSVERSTNFRFHISDTEMNERVCNLKKNIRRVTQMAEARYRDIRGRCESSFRQEIIGLIQKYHNEAVFFEKHLVYVLDRLREFWAFLGVYMLSFSRQTQDINLIAYVTVDGFERSYGMNGQKLGSAANIDSIKDYQMHPCAYLHKSGDSLFRANPVLRELLPYFQICAQDPSLHVPTGSYYLFIMVPVFEMVYAFIFCVRNESQLSRLPNGVKGGVSQFCQNWALETCTEVTYRLGTLQAFVNERERALRSISGGLAHLVLEPLTAASAILSNIRDDSKLSLSARTKVHISGALAYAKLTYILCNGLLDATHIEEGQDLNKKAVRLRIRDELEQLKNTLMIRTGNKKTVTLFRENPEISMNKSIFLSVFLNMIDNAIKYSDKGSNISISYGRNNQNHVVEIKSEGQEISAENREKVFEKRWRGPKSYHRSDTGLGIGCWVSRILMQSIGGDIVLVTDGKTSIFKVLIPGREMI